MLKEFNRRKMIQIIICVAVCMATLLMPIPGLEADGQKAFAITLLAVLMWSFGITETGYVGLLICGLFIVSGAASADVVFSSWMKPNYWMIISSFLIAEAVTTSGIAKKIASFILLKYVRDWNSLVGTILVINLCLAFVIPCAFPRIFILLSIVKQICDIADIKGRSRRYLSFAVFAFAIPIILIFLTADPSLNCLFLSVADLDISWMRWFIYMGVPGLAATLLTYGIFMVFFRPEGKIEINTVELQEQIEHSEKLNEKGRRTVVWIAVLSLFWITSEIHKIDIMYGTLVAVALMSIPGIGGLIGAKEWKSIPLNLLCFMSGAMAIGSVGASTGMIDWISGNLMFDSIPDNPYVIAAIVTLITMVLHMFFGSIVSVMAICLPILQGMTAGMCLSQECVSFIVYITISIQYLLPYHNLPLVTGSEAGDYGNGEVFKMGLLLTAGTFIVTVAVCVPWWGLVL